MLSLPLKLWPWSHYIWGATVKHGGKDPPCEQVWEQTHTLWIKSALRHTLNNTLTSIANTILKILEGEHILLQKDQLHTLLLHATV